jgi:XTP/dITP diphosphohydrolase
MKKFAPLPIIIVISTEVEKSLTFLLYVNISPMQKILIATRNFGKFKELMEVLEDLPFKFVSLNDEKIAGDVEENGETYEENAIIKAEFFGRESGLPTIADDSGIRVDALNGELGVHTRRWGAGEKAGDEEWLGYFLKRMSVEKNKRAEFISAIALYRPGAETLAFRGECVGQILDNPQVDLEPGIPLSAVFLPDGKDKVFSALARHEKNEISHRGKAVKKCHDYLLKYLA